MYTLISYYIIFISNSMMSLSLFLSALSPEVGLPKLRVGGACRQPEVAQQVRQARHAPAESSEVNSQTILHCISKTEKNKT